MVQILQYLATFLFFFFQFQFQKVFPYNSHYTPKPPGLTLYQIPSQMPTQIIHHKLLIISVTIFDEFV